MPRKFQPVFLLPFCIAIPAAAAIVEAPPKVRLGDNIRPVRYAVELKLTPPDDTFSGTIDIDMEIRQSTSTIWMNGTNLTVRQATVRSGSQTVEARVTPEGRDFLGFATARPVGPGPATIHVVYEGKLSKKSSDGLFLNKEGEDWYVFSQFEPISARKAFPCFDEPSFKVPWQVTILAPKEHHAFSNTPQVSEAPGPGDLKTVKFAETKPLPSYLIAVASGPMDIVDGGKAGRKKVPIRILAPRGRAADARYAAEVTGEIVTRLENYFGIPYPYEKLDSVALPLIYGFGAMENAGLITYAQGLLLAPRTGESVDFRRNYAAVAAHEIAHQWFGDLVTLAWWDDTWLNEAFATWMEQKILAAWRPEWETPVSDVFSAQGAMSVDSLVSARKVRQPILSNSDIANAFDGITYQKGAAVIRMFESWVGERKFQQGIKHYLDSHSYRNATAADFLASISGAAKRDIAPAFSSFLDQPGVPMVSMKLECGGKRPLLALSQKRYLPLGSPGSPPETWQIPVCVKFGEGASNGRACTLLTGPTAELELPAKSCPAWVLGNADEQGYYRVLYQGDLLEKLLQPDVASRNLTIAERVGVLGDARALVTGGELPAASALRVVPRFADDPHRQVVSSVMGIVQSSGGNLLPPALGPNYARFIRDVFGKRAHELGWLPKPGESEDTGLLRPALVGLVARRGEDAELVREARDLAIRWLDDRKAIPPDMVNAVLATAAEFGDRALWDRFFTAAKSAKDFRDRRRLIGVLGDFRDPELTRAALNLILGNDFDARETLGLLYAPLQLPETREIPFEFVKQNFDALLKKLPSGIGSDAGATLPGVAGAFCDERRREEVKQFFEPRIAEFSGGPRNLARVLESIGICSAVKKVQQPSIAQFFQNY